MDKLNEDISEYCKLNDLDEQKFIEKIMRVGFNIEKYGNKPELFVNKSEVTSVVTDEPKKEEITKPEGPIKKRNLYGE